MKYTSGFFLFILLWTACKKAELPPTSFDDPVFTVTFFTDTINSQTVTAGKDNRYLFTDFEASDFVVCSGAFSETDCPDADCPGSLTFEFKSLQTDPFATDTVFHLGNYQFLSPDSVGSTLIYRATFNAINGAGYNSFSWKINDQDAGSGPSIEVNFPDISVSPKFIELTAEKTSGLQSAIGRRISLTNPGGNQFPGLNINVLPDSNFIILVAETTGPPYNTLVWGTGDTSEIIFQDSLLPSYAVFSTDGAGNPAFAAFDGLTVNDVPVRTANFTYTVELINNPQPPGEVAIQWVDAQGMLWRSDEGPQDATAFFTVIKSEPYEQNERGQKTRKMQVSFNCLLFNDAGESRFFAGSGVIAVAHP